MTQAIFGRLTRKQIIERIIIHDLVKILENSKKTKQMLDDLSENIQKYKGLNDSMLAVIFEVKMYKRPTVRTINLYEEAKTKGLIKVSIETEGHHLTQRHTNMGGFEWHHKQTE